MAMPARRPVEQEEGPPVDPAAIDRAYLRHRAQRRARLERRRSKRLAGLRFWIVLALLLAGSVYLGITIWHEVQHLFGL